MSNDTCHLSNAVLKMEEIADLICYHIIAPIYFFVGMFGNMTLLIAFHKQSKKDAAYGYQVFLTISKACEILGFTCFIVNFKLGAAAAQATDDGGVDWYKRNYFLMFYVAHVVCVVANIFITSSLFCSVAMAADRVFALTKPFVYKNIQHKKHQIVAAASCFALSVILNLYDAWSWMVMEKPIRQNDLIVYAIRGNPEFVGTNLSMGLANLRTAIRIICVAVLIGLNLSMAITFKRQTMKIGQTDTEKERKRKKVEKTLLVLSIYQSTLMTVQQLPHCAYYIAQFLSVEFTQCWGAVLAPFVDSCLQICDAADFFVILTINRSMRKAIFSVLPCKRDQSNQTAVSNISIGQTRGSRVQD